MTLDGSVKTSCSEGTRSSAVVCAMRRIEQCIGSMVQLVKETYAWLVWIPLLLLALGIGMNSLAVTMNHGIMPVVLPASGTIAHEDKIHLAATTNSRFLFLCDWIQLHTCRGVASPGDCLIAAGELLKWPVVWMWVGFSCCSRLNSLSVLRSPD